MWRESRCQTWRQEHHENSLRGRHFWWRPAKKTSKHCSTVSSQIRKYCMELNEKTSQCCYEEVRGCTASKGWIHQTEKRIEVQVSGNYVRLERKGWLSNHHQNSPRPKLSTIWNQSCETKACLLMCVGKSLWPTCSLSQPTSAKRGAYQLKRQKSWIAMFAKDTKNIMHPEVVKWKSAQDLKC